jgi:hypothetical protein
MAELPHFIIIGAMKAGTTTLYAWLTDAAGAARCAEKEPNFFSDEYGRGVGWYRSLFADGDPARHSGEASTQYTGFKSEDVAPRMRELLPDVRLVYLVREPAERLRSHYRHNVLLAREDQPFDRAIRASRLYLGYSCYWSRLQPFIAEFPREQILVTRAEDLFGPSEAAWLELLDHVGLEHVERPDFSRNVSATRRVDRTVKSWAIRRGARGLRRVVPQRVWQAGSHLLTRDARHVHTPDLLAGRLDIPDEFTERFRQETDALSQWLGRPPLWP